MSFETTESPAAESVSLTEASDVVIGPSTPARMQGPTAYAIGLAVILADQLVKQWILYGFQLPVVGSIQVLGPFHLTMVWNQGVSFGLFRGEAEWVRWALAALSLSMLLSSLGTSIANVGLPTLARAFAASFQEVQWVVLAYLLAITTLIVSVGRLGDLLGRRRLLLAGILLFTAASVLCGLAPTLWLLVAARAAPGSARRAAVLGSVPRAGGSGVSASRGGDGVIAVITQMPQHHLVQERMRQLFDQFRRLLVRQMPMPTADPLLDRPRPLRRVARRRAPARPAWPCQIGRAHV